MIHVGLFWSSTPVPIHSNGKLVILENHTLIKVSSLLFQPITFDQEKYFVHKTTVTEKIQSKPLF